MAEERARFGWLLLAFTAAWIVCLVWLGSLVERGDPARNLFVLGAVVYLLVAWQLRSWWLARQ
jgi:hypothetical protein